MRRMGALPPSQNPALRQGPPQHQQQQQMMMMQQGRAPMPQRMPSDPQARMYFVRRPSSLSLPPLTTCRMADALVHLARSSSSNSKLSNSSSSSA